MGRGICFAGLICKEHEVELEIPEFNNAYMSKQNPTDTKTIYMSAKQD